MKQKNKEDEPIRLSPTTGLALFKECPRCFWLHFNKKVHRPRGIFPSLPGGMDIVIKKYFDTFRGGLPPELKGKVEGTLLRDMSLMEKWRNWRTGLSYYDADLNAALFGALDDCIIDDGHYVPLDYKTRGFPPQAGDSEKFYQTQLDTYAFLLHRNHYTTKAHAYLIYYYPLKVREQGGVTFDVIPVKITTDLTRAEKTFTDAAKLLRGPLPQHHSSCEYCSWVFDRLGFE